MDNYFDRIKAITEYMKQRIEENKDWLWVHIEEEDRLAEVMVTLKNKNTAKMRIINFSIGFDINVEETENLIDEVIENMK